MTLAKHCSTRFYYAVVSRQRDASDATAHRNKCGQGPRDANKEKKLEGQTRESFYTTHLHVVLHTQPSLQQRHHDCASVLAPERECSHDMWVRRSNANAKIDKTRHARPRPPTMSKRKLTFHTRTNHADEKPSTQNWKTRLGSAANPKP